MDLGWTASRRPPSTTPDKPPMKTTPPTSDSDSFRIVDLFSPSEDVGSPQRAEGTVPFHARPVSTEMPASFIYMNPFFAPTDNSSDGERV